MRIDASPSLVEKNVHDVSIADKELQHLVVGKDNQNIGPNKKLSKPIAFNHSHQNEHLDRLTQKSFKKPNHQNDRLQRVDRLSLSSMSLSDSMQSPFETTPCLFHWGSLLLYPTMVGSSDIVRTSSFGVEIEVDCFSVEQGEALTEQVNRMFINPYRLQGDRSSKPLHDVSSSYQFWSCVYEDSVPHGVEFVSPVMKLQDTSSLHAAIHLLRRSTAEVSQNTGIHVHIDAKEMTIRQVLRFLHVTYNIEPLIYMIFNTDPYRMDTFCLPIQSSQRSINHQGVITPEAKYRQYFTQMRSDLSGKDAHEISNLCMLHPQRFDELLHSIAQHLEQPALGSSQLAHLISKKLPGLYHHRFKGINISNLFPKISSLANPDAPTIELRYFNAIFDSLLVEGMVAFALHVQQWARGAERWDVVNPHVFVTTRDHHQFLEQVLDRLQFPRYNHVQFVQWLHRNIDEHFAKQESSDQFFSVEHPSTEFIDKLDDASQYDAQRPLQFQFDAQILSPTDILVRNVRNEQIDHVDTDCFEFVEIPELLALRQK